MPSSISQVLFYSPGVRIGMTNSLPFSVNFLYKLPVGPTNTICSLLFYDPSTIYSILEIVCNAMIRIESI